MKTLIEFENIIEFLWNNTLHFFVMWPAFIDVATSRQKHWQDGLLISIAYPWHLTKKSTRWSSSYMKIKILKPSWLYQKQFLSGSFDCAMYLLVTAILIPKSIILHQWHHWRHHRKNKAIASFRFLHIKYSKKELNKRITCISNNNIFKQICIWHLYSELLA